MLEFLRKSSTSFWAWLILLALAAAFGLSFGLPSDSLSMGTKPIVEVHGESIGDEDYRAQYSLVSGFIGVPKDARMQKMLGVKEEVLESAIERELLAHAGEEMGLASTQFDAEELVAKGHIVVLGDSGYWTGLDQFNYKAFKNFLAALQIPENRYYDLQTREVLARTVRDVVRSSVVVPEPELRTAYEKTANMLSLRYARYEVAPYADLVDPTDADVTAWVEGHTDELKATLETQGSRFTKLPAQVRVSVIGVGKPAPEAGEEKLAAARAKIDAARIAIDSGEDFRAIARAQSTLDTAPKGGDFGWTGVKIGTGIDPVIDTALATLEVDALSEVLVGETALYLVRVEGKREGDVPEADALRELANEAIKDSKGKALARVAAEEDRDKLAGGAAIGVVFNAPGLEGESGGIEDAPIDGEAQDDAEAIAAKRPKAELRETGMFSKSSEIPGLGLMPDLVEKAWAAEADETMLGEVFETSGALILAGLEKKETASDEGFAEARADLLAAAWQRKGMRVTANWAERLCLEAKGKGDIVVSEDKVKRIINYDTETKEGEPDEPTKPYSVCDRVGNQGGLLRAAFMGGQGR